MNSLIQYVQHLFRQGLSPFRCAHCLQLQSSNQIFCSACALSIIPVVPATITVTPYVSMKVLCCSAYEPPLKNLIDAKKFSNQVASHQLAQLIGERMNLSYIPADLLVPVPLHWTRYAYRGYNQAYEMANVLKKYMNIPVIELVGSNRRTQYQFKLNATEREQNVKDAFYLKTEYAQRYSEKHIVIVDDLMTSGSTLQAVAKALLPLKPASLTAVVACRVK